MCHIRPMTTQNIITRTEKTFYIIQREVSSFDNPWRDTWKYDNFEEAREILLRARTTYTNAIYRLIKREEVEDVYSM